MLQRNEYWRSGVVRKCTNRAPSARSTNCLFFIIVRFCWFVHRHEDGAFANVRVLFFRPLSFFLPLRIFNCYLPCHPLPLVPCQPAPLSLVPSSTCPLVNSSLGSKGLPARNHTFAPLQAHLCPQAGSPLPGRLGKGDLWQWWGQGWGRSGIFRALCFFNYNL